MDRENTGNRTKLRLPARAAKSVKSQAPSGLDVSIESGKSSRQRNTDKFVRRAAKRAGKRHCGQNAVLVKSRECQAEGAGVWKANERQFTDKLKHIPDFDTWDMSRKQDKRESQLRRDRDFLQSYLGRYLTETLGKTDMEALSHRP